MYIVRLTTESRREMMNGINPIDWFLGLVNGIMTVFNWILTKLGVAMQATPEVAGLALLIVLIYLLVIIPSRATGIVQGAAWQRNGAANPVNPHLVAWMNTYATSGRALRDGLIWLLLVLLPIVYIGWQWQIQLAILQGNPFEMLHQVIQGLGAGFQSKPYLVLVIVWVFMSFRAGRELGRSIGNAEGIWLQRGRAAGTPLAGTADVWTNRRWERRLLRFAVSIASLFVILTYMLWLMKY